LKIGAFLNEPILVMLEGPYCNQVKETIRHAEVCIKLKMTPKDVRFKEENATRRKERGKKKDREARSL